MTPSPSADFQLQKAKRADLWNEEPPTVFSAPPEFEKSKLQALRERIGSIHLDQRLGIENDKQARVFGQGRTFFHIENWSVVGWLVKYGLVATGLLSRGKRNARDVVVRENTISLPHLPVLFADFTILHISDLHLDMAEDIPHTLIQAAMQVDYDICVLTGDFRAKTYGDYNRALDGLRKLRPHLKPDVYAVLGNHDSILMVPEIEALDIQVLLNEHVFIERANGQVRQRIHLAGIDDAHYYKTDNFDKAAQAIAKDEVSILLSHTPEVYQHAAYANFDLMLCGHTHGGQICLPGGVPVLLNADCPRQVCLGAWGYRQMQGYTSAGAGACVIDVRFNCPPEMTLHRLCRDEP